jgi:hypothetical protein
MNVGQEIGGEGLTDLSVADANASVDAAGRGDIQDRHDNDKANDHIKCAHGIPLIRTNSAAYRRIGGTDANRR